ncbi:MAG: hypothetical protein R3345_10040 [Fulvivirga sp.]|nr:hypothetical protein [Fulvivirga sp.]
MKNLNKELAVYRILAAGTVCAVILMTTFGFTDNGNTKFKTIDVERINIVEPDGTVKMVITNVDQFPNGKDSINGRPVNEDRKKRSGMLFFNEDGMECGGLIYDGKAKENGHSSGLSLTYDQYDGDQVMQLITTDYKKEDKRMVSSALVFNDRAPHETQLGTSKIFQELRAIEDREERRAKYKNYVEQGVIGSAPRIMLGKTRSENNGLFLFGDKGEPRARFYVDKENNVKLEVFNEEGKVSHSWPE